MERMMEKKGLNNMNDDLKEMQTMTVRAFARVRKTTGLNVRCAMQFVRNAWMHGKTADQFKLADQRKYMGRYARLSNGKRAELRVYNGYLLVFGNDEKLITLHKLPETFNSKQIYDGKKRVRNAKKYARYHDRNGNGERYDETA